MKSMASRIGLSLLLLALLFANGATAARAEAITVMSNTTFTVTGSRLVACAAGGAGELVSFTGTFHNIYSFTGSSGGPVHYRFMTLAQNIKGVGQVTGDTYVYSGGFMETGVLSAGETVTTVNNYRFIGPGPDNNLIVRSVAHYTINANGEMVVDFDISDATCG